MKTRRRSLWPVALACALLLLGAACLALLKFGPTVRDLLGVGLKTVVKLQ